MQQEGVPIRFLRAVYVPEERACFHLYRAGCAEHVSEAARRAELAFTGLVEAIALPGVRS